jgi:hypothetical protein
MSRSHDRPLVPRHGHTLKVILPCRVSDPGPGKQDERSNDDQEAMLRARLKDYLDGEVSITVVAGAGSGKWLEREEYLQLIEIVETEEYDLVFTEGLGRIVRRLHAHLFCELCVDHGTRLIALNEHVDTAEEGRQDRSIFSAWHREPRHIRPDQAYPGDRYGRLLLRRFGDRWNGAAGAGPTAACTEKRFAHSSERPSICGHALTPIGSSSRPLHLALDDLRRVARRRVVGASVHPLSARDTARGRCHLQSLGRRVATTISDSINGRIGRRYVGILVLQKGALR